MKANAPAPNYTQIPNILLDGMADFSEPELRVALVVCRQTLGWHRERAVLSIAFLESATGMSDSAIIPAVVSLIAKGWLEKLKNAGERGASAYAMIISEVPTTLAGRADDVPTTLVPSTHDVGRSSPRHICIKESTKKEEGRGGGEIPANLRTEAFREAWSLWLEDRKSRRKIVTPTAVKMQFKKLAVMGPERAVKAIENSIANGYLGIFEPNQQNETRNRTPGEIRDQYVCK